MKGVFKVTIGLTGFRETKALLNTNSLAGTAWRELMEAIGSTGESAIRNLGPRASGRLVARASHSVQKRPLPFWTVIRTRARRKNYPYPRLTAFSPYAQSRYRTGTNPNRGWWMRVLGEIDRGVSAAAQRAMDEIARKWGQG